MLQCWKGPVTLITSTSTGTLRSADGSNIPLTDKSTVPEFTRGPSEPAKAARHTAESRARIASMNNLLGSAGGGDRIQGQTTLK
jgi:hypothetical protein